VVEATGFAAALLEPIPANRTAAITVLSAADGVARVAMPAAPHLGNVIGSLHSSGLAALVDAAGLAAVISAAGSEEQLDGVVPLGAEAQLRFLAPARGPLAAECALTDDARTVLATLYDGQATKVRVVTTVTVRDDGLTAVCEGSFVWSVRRSG
jgi:acyl-coenzyme A thioesterase PaaI-like protein